MEQFRREIAEDNLNPDTRIFFSWGSNELIDNPGLEDRYEHSIYFTPFSPAFLALL